MAWRLRNLKGGLFNMANINWDRKETVAQKEQKAAVAAYQHWKGNRHVAVSAITVEVDGMMFDGDEESQNRMACAVAAADLMSETTEWTLADNTVVTVTVQQLKTACRLAGEEQTRIWNEGRPA